MKLPITETKKCHISVLCFVIETNTVLNMGSTHLAVLWEPRITATPANCEALLL
jgi:hypothetical protein